MKEFKKEMTQSVDRRRSDNERTQASNLTNLVQNLNLHLTSTSKDNNNFKKKIDKLNYDFYIETEKFLQHKKSQPAESEKCQESLFFILFQQIKLYIEEVERLNMLLISTSSTNESMKDKIQAITALEKEKQKQKILNEGVRKQTLLYEKKIFELKDSNMRLKRDLESANRQLRFYKDKLKLDLLIKKRTERLESSKNKGRSLNKSFISNYSQVKRQINMSFNFPQNYNLLKTPEASSKKKSGYYSKSITHQVIKSNESSVEKKANYEKGFKTKNHKNSGTYDMIEYSNLYEDEKLISQNNNSLMMELDIINSTYQSTMHRTFKKEVSRNKLRSSSHRSTENWRIERGTLNSLNRRSISKDYEGYGIKASQRTSEPMIEERLNNITPISTNSSIKNKLNTLKFKLSESNINELMHKLTSNLEEEMKWLEKCEVEFSRMKLSNDTTDKSKQLEQTSSISTNRTNRSFLTQYQPAKKKVFNLKPKKVM